MTDKSFQQMLDEAVEKAVDRYIERLVERALDENRYLTVAEVAQLTGFSSQAIRGFIGRSHDPLPAFRVDKEYRIKLKDFEQWYEQYRTNRVGVPA